MIIIIILISTLTDKLGTEKDWNKICLDGICISVFQFCVTTLKFYWADVDEKLN